jgi:hypothetical protein
MAAIAANGLGQRAFINYDRVARWSWESLRSGTGPRGATFVPAGDRNALTLGVVMAHEIGHLLLGSNSHSARGVMRAEWSQQLLEGIYEGREGFSAAESRRMRQNVEARREATVLARAAR